MLIFFSRLLLLMKRFHFLFLLLYVMFVLSSCKKDNDNSDSNLPHAYVNFYMDLNSVIYMDLNKDGGYIYVTGGVKGIIIYRSINEFYAYDRLCTLRSDTCKILEMEKNGFYCFDSSCKSKFLILDGSPEASGPAKIPLIKYKTSFDGRYLHVYN